MTSAIIATLLTAMAPISELRGAIPLGLSLGLPPQLVYGVAFLGNALPVLPLLWFLKHGSAYAMQKSDCFARMMQWVFDRTRRKHGNRFEDFGFWALLIFVAIPFPLTGAWTGAVIAYLVGMPPKKAGFAILSGIAIAGLLVLGLTLGIIQIF